MLDKGLFRIARPWPPRDLDGRAIKPDFDIEVVRDPTGCNASARWGLHSASPMVSVFRRPRPVANFKYILATGFEMDPVARMYLKLATGRGRRNTETMGEAECRPQRALALQPVGSRTTSMSKSGLIARPSRSRGGQGRAIRNSPLSSNSECEVGSTCGRSGQFDPSNAANSGSLPPVSAHRPRAEAAERLMPSAG